MNRLLEEHFGYLSDRVRNRQFEAAVTQVVTPGDVVMDLGCGAGILGLLCFRSGAERVYAVDSTAVIAVARQAAERAGVADRVTFLRSHSGWVVLPEPVDLIVCDHVGCFGFDYGILGIVTDARKRFLKPGGRLIPKGFRLEVAPIHSETVRKLADRWHTNGMLPEFHWLRSHAVNAKHLIQVLRDALLGEPATLGHIDLYADSPDYLSWTVELRIARDGVLHGLAGWFVCELADGVWMTNSPLADEPIKRAQAYLPIEEPVAVRQGESVKATIMARPADHLIAWVVELPGSGRRFNHSTWQGLLLEPEELARSKPSRVPHLRKEGLARNIVLGYCDGKRTAQDIERAVLKGHPNLFPTEEATLRFVRGVLWTETDS